MKVEWGYVISTLIFRFAGIFVVLGALVILMTINGGIISRLERWKERRRKPGAESPAPELTPAASGPTSADEVAPATLAAIGLALSLNAKRVSQAPVASATAHGDGGSSWQMAGRLRQFDSRSPR